MSLKLQICAFLSDDCKTLYFFDKTGLYDAVTNTGGYSTPNPEASQFTTAVLDIILAGSTVQEPAIDIFDPPDFPSSTTTNCWVVTAASLGLTVFPKGLTRVTYTIDNTNSSDTYMKFKATTLVLALCDIQCCIDKKKLAVAKSPASCGCADSATMDMLYAEALLEAAQAATCCGDIASVNDLISRLDKLCSASACANC